jgi:glycosyltransferase involved in cell wall biosynthesis
MRHLVFVSSELFPYTQGSHGRAMSNMLQSLVDEDRSRTILMMVDNKVDPVAVRSAFPGMQVVHVDSQVDASTFGDSRQHPPAAAYPNSASHWQSACVFRALSALSKRCSFEYVEFSDRGGLAFCTLQERRLQGFLSNASVVVRLGASHTALLHAEANSTTIADLNTSDLERKCLRDCDHVIAHTTEASEVVRAMFGLPKEEWEPRVILHSPAVFLEGQSWAKETRPSSTDQPIVFASELRRSTRPDLFVRGAIGYLRSQPSFLGQLVLYGHCVDEAYVEQIRRLIPQEFVDRTRFILNSEERERNELIASATIVFSGKFEPSPITALMASHLGARVILNDANPEFGEGTPWLDGFNCLKFDGSVGGLVQTLQRNFEKNEKLQPVRDVKSLPPWDAGTKQPLIWKALDDAPMVSIVIPHYNLGSYLEETIDNVIGQAYQNIEIVLVDDASTDPESMVMVNMVANKEDRRINVVRLKANVGLAATRNIGVRHSNGKYVLTLDADDLIDPDFITSAVTALENSSDFDVVVTPAGYFEDGVKLPVNIRHMTFSDYLVFSGEAVVAGLLENKFSTATAVFRKSALDRFSYDESLGCYEDWSLFMRMCEAGSRFIVATDIFFFYRRRPNSMVHTPRTDTRMRTEYRDMLRTSAPPTMMQKSRHLLIGLPSPVVGVAEPNIYDELMRKTVNGAFGITGQHDDRVVFAALKISRWMELRMPWLLRASLNCAQRTRRIYLKLRDKSHE